MSKINSSREEFLALPVTEEECGSVDMDNGLWVKCAVCDSIMNPRAKPPRPFNIVACREDRPFTLVRWIEHKRSAMHKQKLGHLQRSTLEQKEKNGDITRLEQGQLNLSRKKQKTITFLPKVTGRPSPMAATESVTAITTTATRPASTAAAATANPTATATASSLPTTRTCEGIIKAYRSNTVLQNKIDAYVTHCSISSVVYVAGKVSWNGLSQVFAVTCKPNEIMFQTSGKVYQCKECINLSRSHGSKMRQTIETRGGKIINAIDILHRSSISPVDLEFMTTFEKSSNDSYSATGLDLKKRIASHVKFYLSTMSSSTMNEKSIQGQSNSLPSIDKFLHSFNRLYLSSESFRGNLMVGLLTAFVAKTEGSVNPQYSQKVLNFMLALSASGDRKAFQFVSANLCSVSVRHIARITSSKRSSPFIDLDHDEMVLRIKEQIKKIRSHRNTGGLSDHVAFTAGFDATVLAKSFQVHYNSNGNAVVGGAYPNHYMSLPQMDDDNDAATKFLRECVDGKKGESASEIKVCVLSFQCTPPGTPPYYTLVGRPQTINEANDFGDEVVKACLQASKEDGASALLNTTTDGVSTEVKWNQKVICDYLSGKINYVSLPDTNHNVKNSRYQLLGGSSPASIGRYVFDPSLLRLAKVNQKLWRVEDFASDAVLLKLASVDTIRKLNIIASRDDLNCDIGNHAVTVVSLLFIRLRAYCVNARLVSWRDRALYSWMTLVWFTSFHTSGSTMMANKRNMLLETVGFLFLVTRDDVFHPRRNTSECNEHTYGMWRTMSSSREFNMDQLIRIVQKSNIRTDAIFNSELKTRRSKDGLSGYQATFEEYVQSVTGDNQNGKQFSGPVNIDMEKSAVTQLWDDVQGVIEYGNASMRSFLGLFGIEEGNGLSPFATSIATPSDFIKLIEQFFKPPKPDNRGHDAVTQVISDLNNNEEINDSLDNDDNDEETSYQETEDSGLSPDLIAMHVSEINECATDSITDIDLVEDQNLNQDGEGTQHTVDTASMDEGGNDNSSMLCIREFMALMNCGNLDEVNTLSFNLIQLLELGKMAAGSIASESKYMSRNQRWFRAKEGGNSGTKSMEGEEGSGNENDELGKKYVTKNSLIQLQCVRGKKKNEKITIEYYRVLGFFTKTYNKWYMAVEDRFIYMPNEPNKMSGVRFLAQLMEKKGASYSEVNLTTGGQWGPTHVYCIRSLNDIKGLPVGDGGKTVVLDLYNC